MSAKRKISYVGLCKNALLDIRHQNLRTVSANGLAQLNPEAFLDNINCSFKKTWQRIEFFSLLTTHVTQNSKNCDALEQASSKWRPN